MKGCVFVTGKDNLYGFALAGFRQVVVNKENVLEVMVGIMADEHPGLLFIDERLLSEHIMGRLQLQEKQWGGAIITLPAPEKRGESAGEDFGNRFVARVLGYQMKLS